MRVLTLVLILISTVAVAEEYPEVKVAEPYLELHTGPGQGYPIFYVVDRDEFVDVLKRKTDWFKVRTNKGKVGWVNREQMVKTLMPGGKQTELKEISLDDFSSRRWEIGVVGGIFNEDPVMSFYGAYAFTPNLSSELTISKVIGDFSSSQLISLNLMSQPFVQWRYSPFFTLGMGYIETEPKVTLIQAQDRNDLIAHVGVGIKMHLTRRFILRGEYKHYVAFSSDDNNEEFAEWKAGFAFFF